MLRNDEFSEKFAMSIPENLFPVSATPSILSTRSRPFVRIVEPPSKSVRYRYVSEGRPGTIPGVSKTPENRTPFTIEIVGYQGRVVVVVSCVTHEQPYKPHPHNLQGPNCKDGYCTIRTEVTPENSRISFPKLAVQCVKRQDMKEALKTRQSKNIDPFLTGFEHSSNIKSIELNVVRLCIQVFLKEEGRVHLVLNPVVSEPIHNRKTPDPLIYRLSQCNCCVNGNVNGKDEDIILLCTKMTKEDIKIRFYEVRNGEEIWEDVGRFKPNHVYNNSAICFKPPQYYNQNIIDPVKVFIQLVRLTDEAVSPPVEFEYLPLDAEPNALRAKRMKFGENPLFTQLTQISRNVQEPAAVAPLSSFVLQSSQETSYVNQNKRSASWDYALCQTSPNSNFSTLGIEPQNTTFLQYLQNLDTSRDGSSTSKETTPSSVANSEFPASPLSCFVNNIDMNQSSPVRQPPSIMSIQQNGLRNNFINCEPQLSPLNYFLNDIDRDGPSTSTTKQNIVHYNINSDELNLDSDIHIESANVVCKMLNLNQNENELPDIHLSSGDLDMPSVERLSESFHENLVV